MNSSENPWLVPHQDLMPGACTCDVHDRLAEIKSSTDLAWLRRAMAWSDSQLTVRKAAAARIRRLTRPTRQTGPTRSKSSLP
jgi:hypothetical protein